MYQPPYHPDFYNSPSPYMIKEQEKRGIKKTVNALCLTLIAAMLLMYGLAFLFIFYLKAIGYKAVDPTGDFSGYTPVLYYLVIAARYVIALAIPPLIYFTVRHIKLSDALPFEPVKFSRAAAYVFFGSAVCMLANIPANIVVEIEKTFGLTQKMDMPLTNDIWVLALYGITVCIIPPIVEELLFRGMVLHSLKKYGDSFAIVVSALLFGLYHQNFVQLVFAFFAGLVMALAVVRTGSLWTSIMIHFINNSVSFALEMTKRFAGNEIGNSANVFVFDVLMVLGAMSLIYLQIKDRSFLRGNQANTMFPLSSKVGAAFSNFGGLLFLILSIVLSVRALIPLQ